MANDVATNPTGDNRADEIKFYAREFAEEAIDALRDVMTDPSQKGAARAMAAKTMLERGFGAPERRVEQKVEHHIFDQRQAHLSALQKLAARNTPASIKDKSQVIDAEFHEIKSGDKNGNAKS